MCTGVLGSIALWVMLVLPHSGVAQTEVAPGGEGPATGGTSAETSPKVDLGRLLKLPDSYQRPAESRRGMGQSEWTSRFEVVRLEIYSLELSLEKAQAELGELAGESGQWTVAAPGTSPNPENTPLSYKLRQEIRRQREAVERAERRLRALEIEADLSNVPPQWRAPGVGRPPQERTEAPDRAGRSAE